MTTTLTKEPTPATDTYLAAFRAREAALCDGAPPWLARQRRAAIARFGELGFPDARNEDWKFTSVAPIVRARLDLAPPAPRTPLAPPPAGVRLMSLREALAACPELVEPHLGQHADFRHHAFAALNTAFWDDGVFLHLPAGVAVEQPIEIAHPATAAGSVGYRRALIVLGRGSQATVVERFEGPSAQYLTNAVTEAVLADGASLDHYKVQREGEQAFHVSVTQASLARDSRFRTHYFGLGGALVRNEARATFTAENGEATVNGLYLARGTQHMDNHTVIDHARPHCASHELYKGVLDGQARGVFNGKIFVRKDAQKTDAKQTNQALLLSDGATINTKPQLEIFADDVKCTHGATVGQLDADQLFYLRARGIGEAQARALLTFAFANDIISRIRIDGLRDQLEHALLASSHLPPLADFEDV